MRKNTLNKNIFIIAETACSHDGSLSRLKKLVKGASVAGADAVQFQIWKHENMVTPKHPNKQKLKALELSELEWENIFKFTRKNYPKLQIIACIYDISALKVCEKLKVDSYKIHTSDLGNYELLNEIAKTKKKVDLSIGGSKINEIKKALKYLKKNEVWLMYGYQLFPTKPANLNLLQMKKYNYIFKKQIGYQDHSPPNLSAYTVPTAAIGSGIKIIEKHITDDRSRKGTDSESALTPKEFKFFVKYCREAFISLGNGKIKKFTRDEERYRIYSKKKIFLKKNLKKNTKLNRKDLVLRQPIGKKGIGVEHLQKIIGKKINRNKKAYDFINKKDLKS